jgi:hypothetical protein
MTAELPEGAIPLEGGGYAFELSKPKPAWYTPEFHQRVKASGTQGVPLPEESGIDIEQSGLAFTGIRPGAWMFSPSWCTMNFIFHGTTTTTSGGTKANGGGKKTTTTSGGGGSGWYIGTAGHCAEVGDEVTLLAAPGGLMVIGKTVKSVDGGLGHDFALVEIYPEMVQYINPSMTHWGGPTGTNPDVAVGDPVVHSGHGLVIGTGGTPRAGVVTHVEGTAYGWDGAGIFGDSGSAVRHVGGLAEGNLTHLVVDTRWLPAFIAGTTAEEMERIAGVPICDAPLVPNPLPNPTCAP